MNAAPSMLDNLDLRSHFDKLAAQQADQQSDAEPITRDHARQGTYRFTPDTERLAGPGHAEAAVMENLQRPSVRDNVTLPVHYAQFKIEPAHFSIVNGMDPFQFNIIKYTCRHKMKNGVEDIRKAIRYAQMYAQYLLGNPNWWTADFKEPGK